MDFRSWVCIIACLLLSATRALAFEFLDRNLRPTRRQPFKPPLRFMKKYLVGLASALVLAGCADIGDYPYQQAPYGQTQTAIIDRVLKIQDHENQKTP
jgi:hypothetical protein